jgi:hypothetical protein
MKFSVCRFPNPIAALAVAACLSLPDGAVASADPEEPAGDSRDGPAAAVRAWELSDDEVALKLANPATLLRRIENKIEYRAYQGSLPGADDGDSWIYEFTPVYPIALNNGRIIELRATLPLYLDQHIWEVYYDDPIWEQDRSYADWLLRQSPQVTPSTGRYQTGHDHMADLSIDVAYGGVYGNGLIGMFGLATVWPTSTDISASRDQYLIGPQVVLGKSGDWGVAGARLKHLTDVGGDGGFSTNETWLDVFFAYPLGNGWQIVSNPSVLYDWEGDSGNHLLLPLGGGISKTTRIGRVPIKLDAELYYYVESAERMGTDWMFRLNITPAFSNPLFD